jgi:hypothetical protein
MAPPGAVFCAQNARRSDRAEFATSRHQIVIRLRPEEKARPAAPAPAAYVRRQAQPPPLAEAFLCLAFVQLVTWRFAHST